MHRAEPGIRAHVVNNDTIRLYQKLPLCSTTIVLACHTAHKTALAVSDSNRARCENLRYAYDRLTRPTAVSFDPAPAASAPTAGPVVTFGHAYNAANQRTAESTTDSTWIGYLATSASTTAYTANSLNQYTAVGAVTPTYDGNGNLTSDGTYTLGHDAENRLVSASGAGNSSSYTFDGRSRRKTRTVNGTTTISVTDADNREVLEYDGASGTLLRWYAYGLGPNAAVSQINLGGGARNTLIPNMLGSIVGSYDSTGALTKFGYQPYGRGTAAPQFAYTGQRIDPEIGGLYYYRARHYSTVFGRFLQPDPIGYSGGIHLYGYVDNDPLNGVDPPRLAPEYPADYGTPIPERTFYNAWQSQLSDVTRGSATPSLGSLETHTQVAAAMAGGWAARTILTAIDLFSAATPPIPASPSIAQPRPGPDFIVSPGGTVVPVPTGATGPIATRAPGMQFVGGRGGPGLDAR